MNNGGESVSFDFSGKAVDILALFRDERLVFLLESSLPDRALGRYSFIGFDPFLVLQGKGRGGIEGIRKVFREHAGGPATAVTPFPAGLMGYLTYDFGQRLQNIPRGENGRFSIPEYVLGFYDCVITVDHFAKKLHVCSSGLPERSSGLRKKKARERIRYIVQRLSRLSTGHGHPRSLCLGSRPPRPKGLERNFTRGGYCRAVKKALAYIRRGDIYQVNLSQRFCLDTSAFGGGRDPLTLYRRLRRLSPSCFGGYFDAGDFQVVSSSPERLLSLRQGQVSTRPMKGTRPRGRDPREDRRYRRELLNSRKDQAELLMITDLERNDLGRVCQYGSVRVGEMRTLEPYRTVFQATSTVEGRLREGEDGFGLIEAAFPGGSITGCPKIRAMQIIRELEPDPRGIYTGSMGYVSTTGDMDFNILIRTLLAHRDKISFHVGGGIVADSTPEGEYEETLVKAAAMRDCLAGVYEAELSLS